MVHTGKQPLTDAKVAVTRGKFFSMWAIGNFFSVLNAAGVNGKGRVKGIHRHASFNHIPVHVGS